MNASEISTGMPKIDGRYVVFIQCAAQAAKDWVEPVIMTWAGAHWHTSFLKPKIIGWLGPIPVMKVKDIETPAEPVPPVFDL